MFRIFLPHLIATSRLFSYFRSINEWMCWCVVQLLMINASLHKISLSHSLKIRKKYFCHFSSMLECKDAERVFFTPSDGNFTLSLTLSLLGFPCYHSKNFPSILLSVREETSLIRVVFNSSSGRDFSTIFHNHQKLSVKIF